MNRNSLDKRLRDLGIYSDYYYRKELKSLAQMLAEGERLNCVFTGVNEANRKLVAITDIRIIIIFAAALGSGNVKVIKRTAVRNFSFTKKFLRSRVSITAEDEIIVFTAVQASREELFNWAMNQPCSMQQD